MKTGHDIVQERFGVKTSYNEQPKVTQVETVKTKVLSYNPNRLGLVFVNTGGNNVYLAPSNNVAVGEGILISANGGSISLNILEDFEFASMEFYGISDGAASTCYLVEIVSVT